MTQYVEGHTAWIGTTQICKPTAGETFVVSGGAGAVGSVSGQLAKVRGARVVGIAGSKAKCDWMTNELGFDVAINYKTENMKEALSAAAPDGIDCYFDNVGGSITDEVMGQMNRFGRLAFCGAISTYTNYGDAGGAKPPGPNNWSMILMRRYVCFRISTHFSLFVDWRILLCSQARQTGALLRYQAGAIDISHFHADTCYIDDATCPQVDRARICLHRSRRLHHGRFG